MFPPTINAKTGLVDPATDERTSAWLVRAKGLVQNEKKVEPFSFQEAVCVTFKGQFWMLTAWTDFSQA
jgi:hypothetical protein